MSASGLTTTSSEFEQLLHLLVRVETRLWNLLEAELKAAGTIGLAAFETLRCIEETKLCRPSDIQATLSISSGGVTKLLDRMEKDGLIRRVANAQDRRSFTLVITELGKEKLEKTTALVNSVVEAILGHVKLSDFNLTLAQENEILDRFNQVLITRCWDADHSED